MSTEKQNTNTKKYVRKAGKTLLVIGRNNTEVDTSYFTESNLEGLVSYTEVSTKSSSHFLVFKDVPKAIKALKKLRNLDNTDYLVKFVHYQVFFTCKELEDMNVEDKLEHGELKLAFRKFLQENTTSQLLYPPRIYRKGEKYMGCGYLTIDTKDGVDALLSEDKFKTTKVGEGDKYEVTFYRYRKSDKEEEEKKSGPEQTL